MKTKNLDTDVYPEDFGTGGKTSDTTGSKTSSKTSDKGQRRKKHF
jgi:hypothetical protein